jgi:transmembrane sensor
MTPNRVPPARYVEPNLDEPRIARQYAGVRTALARDARTRRLVVPALVAAMVAVLLVAGLVRSRSGPARSELAAFETGPGAGHTVELSDGSRLELGASTRLGVNELANGSVALVLERGVVVADVAPRKDRAFKIRAAGHEVRVVGTRFEVRIDQERLSVSVERGRVEVAADGSGAVVRLLGAGESWSTKLPSSAVAAAPHAAPSGATPSAPEATVASDTPAAEVDPVPAPSATAATGSSSPHAKADGARALFERAQRARAEGRLADAKSAFRELRERYPDDPRAPLAAFELGRLELASSGDARGASRSLDQAARSAPKGSALQEDALARRVDALDAAGDVKECESARRAYLDRFPAGVHRATVAARCKKR